MDEKSFARMRGSSRAWASMFSRAGGRYPPEPEQTDFLEMLIDECYRAGAGKVSVEWRFAPALRLDIKYQSDETLGAVEQWAEQRLRERAEKLPANIYLDSDDPDGLSGVDQDKWARAQRERFKVTKPYRDAMENKYQWCVAAVPGRMWARKVFPGLSDDEAVERLWEAILRCSRADGDDPIAAWQTHNANLKRRCDWLNSPAAPFEIPQRQHRDGAFNRAYPPDALYGRGGGTWRLRRGSSTPTSL